jgi:hypothetical protein
MVDCVALVKHVRDDLGLGHVGNSRGDHIRHVSVISIFGDIQFGIGIELPNGGQINITAEAMISI